MLLMKLLFVELGLKLSLSNHVWCC